MYFTEMYVLVPVGVLPDERWLCQRSVIDLLISPNQPRLLSQKGSAS